MLRTRTKSPKPSMEDISSIKIQPYSNIWRPKTSISSSPFKKIIEMHRDFTGLKIVIPRKLEFTNFGIRFCTTTITIRP